MEIAVRDLLQLEKKNAGIALSQVYTADGHPQAQKLTLLRVGAAGTTFQARPVTPASASVLVNKFFHA